MPTPALPHATAAGREPALRYQGAASIVVRGPATGRSYAFSSTSPVQAVDPRDAAVLLRTHHFRQDQGRNGG